MSPSNAQDEGYKIQLMSLRTEFLKPKYNRITPSLELDLDFHQNDARLPLMPKLVLKNPQIIQNPKQSFVVKLRHKAKRRMSSRPTVEKINFADDSLEIFFRIPWSKIPEDTQIFYEAIKANNPELNDEDILFLQYYPYIPLHRIKKTQFLDKQLHASFHFEPTTTEEVQRLYYVDRIQRKPVYIDLPL